MGNAAGVIDRHSSESAAALERAILQAIADVRASPQLSLTRLQGRLPHFDGMNFIDPVTKVPVVTKEGPAPVHEMVAILTSAVASSTPFCLEPQKCLSLAAEDHAVDVGATSMVQHCGSDGSAPADRMSRYGSWSVCCGECIWYGSLEGAEATPAAERIVDALLVDDGVPDRGHRKCLLDARMLFAGVGVASHPIFGFCVVIDLAGGVIEGLPAAAAAAEPEAAADVAAAMQNQTAIEKHQRLVERVATGPPLPSQETIDRLRGSANTHWDLGSCASCGDKIQGGKVVSAGKKGLSWHDRCFLCSSCKSPLRGQPHVEVDGGAKQSIVCKTCFENDFAEKCSVCGMGMVERVLTVSPGGQRMHPECHVGSEIGSGSGGVFAAEHAALE